MARRNAGWARPGHVCGADKVTVTGRVTACPAEQVGVHVFSLKSPLATARVRFQLDHRSRPSQMPASAQDKMMRLGLYCSRPQLIARIWLAPAAIAIEGTANDVITIAIRSAPRTDG